MYLLQNFDIGKGKFDMLYLYAGGGGAMIFSFDKSKSLEGGQKKTQRRSGGLPKNERKK